MSIKAIAHLNPTKSTIWSILIFALVLSFTLVSPSHAAAETNVPPGDNGFGCGVMNPTYGRDGDQQAAGLVVNVKWQKYGEALKREDTTSRVQVTTDGYSYKPPHTGGIAKMTADDATELSLNQQETFSQVPAGCQGMGDNIGVVLGYGKTSPNAGGWYHWALDCEETDRSAIPPGFTGSNIFQPFDVTGVGVPSGARAGGTWDTVRVQPVNGTTTYVTVVYTEPPPQPLSAQCTSITIYDDGGYNVPGGNSNPRPTQTHVIVRGTSAIGGAPSPGYGTDPAIDTVANRNPIGNGDHRKWDNLTPISSNIYIQRIRQWQSTNGVWNNYSNTTETIPCYSATCSISVDSQIAGDPNGVKAGQTFTVNYAVFNNGPGGDPDSIEGHQFSLNNGDVNGSGSYWGFSQPLYWINQNQSATGSFTLTAPDSVTTQPLVAHPAYSDLFAFDGAQCGLTVNVYQQFDIRPTAAQPSGNNENPTTVTWSTSGANNGPAANITASWNNCLTYTAPGATPPTGCSSGSVVQSYSGSYTYGALTNGPYTYNPPAIQAGSSYCSHITINPATGWVGPGGILEGQPATADSGSCLKVVNKPFFKVRGSAVEANINVARPDGTCPAVSGSGLLAGWNDNLEYGADRGAGSQLSALALIKISGFASAQTTITRSPTDLTFANTNSGDISSDYAAPDLGGNFGGSARCLSPPKPPTNAGNNASNIITAGTGNFTHTGNLTLGGNSFIGNKTSIFVKGNVYITGNIKYSGSGGSWTLDTVPSFVLVATGNIYVSPNVTELDGLYIAQPDNSGNGGVIYTCGTSVTTACTAGNIYSQAKRQLVVYGSFIANQVRMYRTIGSLRDEKPTPGSGGSAGSKLGMVWSCGGDACKPDLTGLSCTATSERADPNTWDDNQICVPSSSTLRFAWTSNNSSFSGYPYCTLWNVPEDYAQTWNDNKLCSNENKNFTWETYDTSLTNPTRECVRVFEPADPEGQWKSGYFFCGDITPPTPASPPTAPLAPACSNKLSQLLAYTCAAEVFQLSPEFYLSQPAVLLPSYGAPQVDAINSLPPVL